jgi:Protein of unknown function (DUF3572)
MENLVVQTQGSHTVNATYASELGIAALQFLAEDSERLRRFLDLSGLGPHNLRQAAAEPTFLASVLDHIMSDERLLVVFAQSQDLKPEAVARAREALAGPSPDWS